MSISAFIVRIVPRRLTGQLDALLLHSSPLLQAHEVSDAIGELLMIGFKKFSTLYVNREFGLGK